MKHRRYGFTMVELLVVIAIIALLAAILIPALSRVRETSRRAACGNNAKQIVVAQNNFQSLRAGTRGDSFVTGSLDSLRRPARCQIGGSTVQASDASKAFVNLSLSNLIDTLAAYVCPSDPFVAVLNIPGSSIEKPPGNPNFYDDFPDEGTPVDPRWAGMDSPARTESGRTYYSYSQQTRSVSPYASLSPKMNPKIPLVAERNPWSVRQAIPAIAPIPTDDGYVSGNPWAHNREGATISYMDGSTQFLADTRVFEIPRDPVSATALDTDYLYDSDGPRMAVGTVTGSSPKRPPGAGPYTVFNMMGLVDPAGYSYNAGGVPMGWAVWFTD